MSGSNSTAMSLIEEMAQRVNAEEVQKAFKGKDVGIEYHGTKITLPADPANMPTEMAIESLQRKLKDENTFLDVHEILEAYPDDACVAFNQAMRDTYGWASATPKMTMFGPIQPDLLTIKTGPKDTDSVQVPFGQFTLPGIEKPIEMHRHMHEGFPALVITGQVRKKELEVVKQLANDARKILRERSIFKGKSIRFRTDESGDIAHHLPPLFLETDNIKPNELILNPEELAAVQSSIWSMIMHTDRAMKHQIPLNRGVLLEGKYGTGKTMSAHVTSKVCVENGWTYILLDDVRGLKSALTFAQRYQPAVIFAEDIDRVTETRDQEGNDLLNTIDGVLTKNSQVMVVMSTNHVEKINPAMLRPGRLDAIITVLPPGPEAVGRLIRLYGRDLISADESLDKIGELIAGNIPATIREVVERAKLGMIFRDGDTITENDLIASAKTMGRHLELMNGTKPEQSPEAKFGTAFGDFLEHKFGVGAEQLDELSGTLNDATNKIVHTGRNVQSSNQRTQAALQGQANAIEAVKEDTGAIRRAVS